VRQGCSRFQTRRTWNPRRQSITRWRIKREVTGRVKWEGFEKEEHVCLTKVENWLIDRQICQYPYTVGKRIKRHKED